MRKIVPCDFKEEITRDIYEHEVLISFQDDEGACAFNEWWYDGGYKAFFKWAEKNMKHAIVECK